MKHVLPALAVLCGLALSMPAAAEEPLTGEEIAAALTGHTAFYDEGARQYFDAAGWTDYIEPSGPPDRGKWEVRGDQYCSWWERGGWSCYDVTGSGNRITFISGRGTLYPGELVEGNRRSLEE